MEEKEKVILDSKEKIEFYRTKMQDLVSIFCAYFANEMEKLTGVMVWNHAEVIPLFILYLPPLDDLLSIDFIFLDYS